MLDFMAITFIHLTLLGAALIANIGLALIMILRKTKNLAGLYYFFFVCAVAVHILGDLFFQLSTTVHEALFWIYFYWVGFFFLAIFFFYFTTVFPKKQGFIFSSEPAKMILLIIPVGLTYILFFTNEFIANIVLSDVTVNYVQYGPTYLLVTIYLAIFMGLGLIKLLIDYIHTTFESEKKSLQLVFIGIFVGAFFGIAGDTFLIRSLGFGELKLASFFMFIACIIMTYVILKHKIFSIVPVNEKISTNKPMISVEPGKSYFIDEKNKGRKKGFRLFSDSVRHNRQGLVISTDHPNQIRQKYLLEKTPIIWLSDSVEMKKDNIKPNELEALNGTIHLFLDRANNPVILLDGIDKLVIVNGFRKTIEFFKSIMGKVKKTNAIIFFSVGDEEREFVNLFNDSLVIKKTIDTLEKKLLSRQISHQTYQEMLIENWGEFIEKEAEMKVVEEEMVGIILDLSLNERNLIIKKKALKVVKYYAAKRKFGPVVGNEIINDLNKNIMRLEKELLKIANSY